MRVVGIRVVGVICIGVNVRRVVVGVVHTAHNRVLRGQGVGVGVVVVVVMQAQHVTGSKAATIARHASSPAAAHLSVG